MMFGLSVAGNYKTYGEVYFNDDHFITEAGSVGAVFNGLSRVVYG